MDRGEMEGAPPFRGSERDGEEATEGRTVEATEGARVGVSESRWRLLSVGPEDVLETAEDDDLSSSSYPNPAIAPPPPPSAVLEGGRMRAGVGGRGMSSLLEATGDNDDGLESGGLMTGPVTCRLSTEVVIGGTGRGGGVRLPPVW